PSTRRTFWVKKFKKNVERDNRNRELLLAAGWTVIELWECGLRKQQLSLDWLYHQIQSPCSPFLSWPLKPLPTVRRLSLRPWQRRYSSDCLSCLPQDVLLSFLGRLPVLILPDQRVLLERQATS